MKARSLTWVSVLSSLLLLGFGLWLWSEKTSVPRSEQLLDGNSDLSSNAALQLPISTASVSANHLVRNGAGRTPSAQKDGPQAKIEAMKGLLSTYNDVQIDFHGKIVDQFGDPVAGAEVKGSIRVINGLRQGTDRLSTASDKDGLFQFHGKGQDIDVMPSKEGYALASLNGGGNYSLMYSAAERAHPDAENPIIIKMWKLQGAEPLLRIDEHYKVPYTTGPIRFDLLTGRVVAEGGDVQLAVVRSPGTISGENRSSWSAEIAAVEGGLMDPKGQEAVVYAAPETGYVPSMTLMFSTNSPEKWFEGFNQSIFLMSRNGKIYSKLRVSFHINYSPDDLMSVSFRGIANTNSSRNWEADPNSYGAVVR